MFSLFSFFIKYVFIIQFLTASFVKSNELPFHANFVNDSSTVWECKQGYFRTSPTNPLLATCKKCLPLTKADCPSESTFMNCTSAHDAICKSCKPLQHNDNIAWRYMPNKHDCSTLECNIGYYNDSESCYSCPVGSYCVDGRNFSCGNELTTFSTETFSLLGCIPTSIASAWQIQFIFYFDILSSKDNIIFCPSLENVLIMPWLRYGRLVDCTGTQDNLLLESYSTKISCRILISRQYTTEYMIWLTEEIEKQTPQIITTTEKCINGMDISSWDVQFLTLSPDSLYYNMTNTQGNEILPPPKNSPDFVLTNSRIAKGNEIATFIFTISILTCSISLSICFIIVGLILRFRRKQQRATTHTNHMEQIVRLL